MIASPKSAEAQRIARLETENDMLHKKLGELEIKLATLENTQLATSQNPLTQEIETLTQATITHPEKKEVVVDQKCFSDSNDLNQCAVLASLQLTDSISVLVKPLEDITEPLNHIVFEFYSGQNLLTEFRTTTTALFSSEPLAEIVYLNTRDITLVMNVGINNVRSVFSYDGSGWIDYSKYSSTNNTSSF